MPTEVIKTIKSSGGDYTSLSAWEAARNGDLVTADTIEVAECYNFQDTTAVLISGWVTDPTRYIKIYTPTAERHTGVAGTGYRLVVASAQPLRVRESHVRIIGLETKAVTAGYSGLVCDNDTAMEASPYILIDSLLTHDNGAYGVYLGRCGSTGYPLYLINSIIYKCGNYGILLTSGYAPAIAEIYNCTVCNNTTYGIRKDSSSVVVGVKNCYAGANTTDYSSVSGTWTTFTTNASSDTTGTSGLQSIAHSTSSGAYFTNVTAGSENYHIGSSSALKDVGTDLSATFTTDIDGATRSGTWDIGADEITAGGATYDGSVSFGLGMGMTNAGNFIAYPSVSFGIGAGMSDGGNIDMNAGTTFAAVLSQYQAINVAAEAAASLGLNIGISDEAILYAMAQAVIAFKQQTVAGGAEIDMYEAVVLAVEVLQEYANTVGTEVILKTEGQKFLTDISRKIFQRETQRRVFVVDKQKRSV
ncbi:MAG: right-handed parallel beta-helix repeat-containing protein [Deltaproteobacteria bacterium]